MGIHFQEVSYTYQQYKKKKANNFVLSNINLDIKSQGEFIAILGHTGSGKSTLVQMMNGLLVPTLGEVRVMDAVIQRKKIPLLKPVRKKVGLVFQFPEYQLFEETVLKDISFGPKNFGMTKEEAEKKALESAKQVGLSSTILTKNPFSLSGGQMRKVAIAGILASQPDILIFDEPTVGLDPQAKSDLLDLLKSINDPTEANKTIIIVTHDMDVVWEVANRVIVLDQGNIVYDGDKKTLFQNSEFLKEHSLAQPTIVSMLKYVKEKTQLPIDPYQNNLFDAQKEILKVINNE